MNSREKASKYLNESNRMAVYSGDNVAEIRDKAFSYTYRANVKAEIPESIIKALKVKRMRSYRIPISKDLLVEHSLLK